MLRQRIVLMCGAALLWGCGPTLVVRHQDPTVKLARVVVDGQQVGEVAYGDELEVDIAPGWHEVEVEGWWEGGRGVVVEDTCTITLMTPSARRGRR